MRKVGFQDVGTSDEYVGMECYVTPWTLWREFIDFYTALLYQEVPLLSFLVGSFALFSVFMRVNAFSQARGTATMPWSKQVILADLLKIVGSCNLQLPTIIEFVVWTLFFVNKKEGV